MNPRSPFRHLTQKDTAQPVPQAEKTAAKPARAAVALQGDIAAIAIENIFQLFDFAALTGKLEIRTTANTGNFYFRKGMLTYGILQINHFKIGELLLASKMITPEQLQECLQIHEQNPSRQRFGQIFLEKGYIQPGHLSDSLLRQIKQAFFEALSWQQGTFHFYLDQNPAPEEVQICTRIDHLLLEGMVYLDNAAAPTR